jgi:flagellar hook assembly protein FlgD
VKTDEGFLTNNPRNYPNPATSHTKFTLEHNRPGELMYVTIRIFNGAGKLIKTIETETFSQGYQLPDIEWDCRNSNGQSVARGIYIYIMDIETESGEKARESGRIIIL